MHLAYVHYLLPEDTATAHVRQLVGAARRLGHTVDEHAVNLAAGKRGGGGASGGRSGRWAGAMRRYRPYLHEAKELAWNLRYWRLESRLLRRRPPDLLLVRDHTLTASCLLVARQLRLPLVLEMNGPVEELGTFEATVPFLSPLHRWLEGLKLRRADGVVTVSRALREHFLAKHSIDSERVAAVQNGADVDRFTPETEPDRRWLPRGSGPVVGFVGSFQPWHGTELLGRMIERVAEARPEVGFLLVGDGPESPGIRRVAEAFGERVAFAGRVPHERVPSLVAAFDVAVLAEAGFYMSPLKLMEYMAAGKALVAPDRQGIAEVVDHDRTGLLFEAGSADGLCRSVLRLVDQPELRARLGDEAARTARASMSWLDNARQVLDHCRAVRSRYRAVRSAGRPSREAPRAPLNRR